MIPVLYDANKNKIGALSDCTRCYVTQERNGLYEAEVDYPMQSELFSRIEAGCYILAKPDDLSEPQMMRVYKPVKPLYGIASFNCEHERYKLNGVPVARGSYCGTPAAILNSMLTSVDSTSDFTFWSDIDTVKTIDLNTPMTVGQMIGGTEGSVLDRFGGEYEFNNNTVKLYSSRGQEKSTEIRYAKNLTGFTCEKDISSVYTHVYPFYYNEAENQYVEIPYKKITLSNAEDFPFERCYMLDLSGEFDTAPTVAQLRSKAVSFITANSLDEIRYNYKISFLPLWQTSEYKNVAALERCALCDVVPVVHEKAGERVKAKIIRTVYDSIAERYVEMELGNAVSSLSQTVTQSINAVDKRVSKTRSFMQIVIKNATETIVGNRGGYVVLYDSNGDGEPDEILIMNTPSILTATKVWRWNVSGLGYSDHGYAGPYRTAITMDGSIVADFITTGSLNASLITSGSLNASLITSGTLNANLIRSGTISDQTGTTTINLADGTIEVKQSNGGKIIISGSGVLVQNSDASKTSRIFITQNGTAAVDTNVLYVGNNTIISDGFLKLDGSNYYPRQITVDNTVYTVLAQ